MLLFLFLSDEVLTLKTFVLLERQMVPRVTCNLKIKVSSNFSLLLITKITGKHFRSHGHSLSHMSVQVIEQVIPYKIQAFSHKTCQTQETVTRPTPCQKGVTRPTTCPMGVIRPTTKMNITGTRPTTCLKGVQDRQPIKRVS